MENNIIGIIAIAFFIQALVEVVKPIWNPDSKRFAVPEIVSIASGILIAIIGQINLLEGLIVTQSVVGLYILYALSGVAIGRSPSFVHDLWSKMKNFNVDRATEGAEFAKKLSEIIKSILGIEIGIEETNQEEGV